MRPFDQPLLPVAVNGASLLRQLTCLPPVLSSTNFSAGPRFLMTSRFLAETVLPRTTNSTSAKFRETSRLPSVTVLPLQSASGSPTRMSGPLSVTWMPPAVTVLPQICVTSVPSSAKMPCSTVAL